MSAATSVPHRAPPNLPARLPLGPLAEVAFGYVTTNTGLTRLELFSRRRARHLVVARALFVWIVRAFGQNWASYHVVGELLDGRDHTTIINLERKAAHLRTTDPEFARLCDGFAALAARPSWQEEITHAAN